MKICVFCGAKPGKNENYMKEAFRLGEGLVKAGHSLVYGGGRVGLMGAVADGVLAHQGTVIGVIPQSIVDLEVAHNGCTELYTVNTMHERKQMMFDKSDVIVALPGGFGTLDELCEIITWRQLHFHNKKIILFNQDNFYTPFVEFINHCVTQGFISQEHRDFIQVCDRVDLVLNSI